MARKKRRKRKQIEWVHFGAAVVETEVSIESGINHVQSVTFSSNINITIAGRSDMAGIYSQADTYLFFSVDA